MNRRVQVVLFTAMARKSSILKVQGVVDAIRKQLDDRLAIDRRAMDVFRWALGCLLVLEFGGRMMVAEGLLSDQGVFPFETWQTFPHATWPWYSSILALSSSTLWIHVCLSSGVVCSLMLIFGKQLRWVPWALLILLHSLQARNPWTNYAADKLLFLLLFWACFVFAAQPDENRRATRWMGFPAWGLRLQLCVLYLFSVARKSGSTWVEGTAVRYALEIDQYSQPLGKWLLEGPMIWLQMLTWITLLVEWFGPLMLLARSVRIRWMGVASLAFLQLGFLLTMDLGWFPWVCLLGLLPHVPLSHRKEGIHAVEVNVHAWGMSTRVAGWMVLWMLLWNLAMNFTYPDTLKSRLPSVLSRGIECLRMDQYWGMFSPNPMIHDGWFVIAATLSDGEVVDLLDPMRKEVWAKPLHVPATFPGDRWREFMMMLYDYPDQAHLWPLVAKWFQHRWDQAHPGQSGVTSMRVVYMMEKTLPEGVASPEKEQLWPEDPSGQGSSEPGDG